MEIRRAVVIIASLAITIANVSAQEVGIYTSGPEITKSCRAYLQLAKSSGSTSNAQLAYDAGFCLGAVYLTLDTDALHREQLVFNDYFPKFCLPKNANSNDIAEVVANFVDSHPELRTLAGYVLIRRAIASAWPC